VTLPLPETHTSTLILSPVFVYLAVPPVTLPLASNSVLPPVHRLVVAWLNVSVMVVVLLLGLQVIVPLPPARPEVGAVAVTYLALVGEHFEIVTVVVALPVSFEQLTVEPAADAAIGAAANTAPPTGNATPSPTAALKRIRRICFPSSLWISAPAPYRSPG
jgi:hypothetical protein